jgi:hypothetical protein
MGARLAPGFGYGVLALLRPPLADLGELADGVDVQEVLSRTIVGGTRGVRMRYDLLRGLGERGGEVVEETEEGEDWEADEAEEYGDLVNI